MRFTERSASAMMLVLPKLMEDIPGYTIAGIVTSVWVIVLYPLILSRYAD